VTAPSQRAPDRRSFPLLLTLSLAIGSLVLVTVGSVLLLQRFAGLAVVHDFAARVIESGLDREEEALRLHLDAAVHQADYIVEALRSGRYAFSDPAFGDFVEGSLAAAPQIGAVLLARADGSALSATREPETGNVRRLRFDLADDPQLAELAGEISERKTPYWGPPVYRQTLRTTYLNYRVPIRRDGAYLGFLTAAISTDALSELAEDLSDPPTGRAFMLYGADRVLAYPTMTDRTEDLSEARPLLPLSSLGDRVIEDLPRLPPLDEAGIEPPPGARALEATVEGERYLVFVRDIDGYGALPITYGVYRLASAVDASLRTFYWATVIAVVLLCLSLVIAAVVAGTISRPIRRAAEGAAKISTLDFDKVTALSGSYLKEIDQLARSFNAMLEGLNAFGRYVPRKLVARLLKEGRAGAGTEERDLAIMFTDIAGFTSTCEDMSAAEVAAFVNHHLALVCACIEQEDGTIDKYIGDSVMAFWGAPGRIDNPGEAACRAAVAIRRAIELDNVRRRARGQRPVHLRVGIHLGPVVVGDIGTPNRINYTIVGDAVNAAQRLESLGKTVAADEEVVVLISRQVSERLTGDYRLIDRGSHVVKGKHEALAVYELMGTKG